ncbi:hypothetical protein FW778_21360 [Ginsengibacter hankyongi]|uniref:DUF3899 domain-containing protein n=1 Tax=Ginsengibacter hankyongi TaxID=2607284 RepID=A0A5J5IB58_9BACT|nr:hypothetical protein [Ginsengibacter hankyongi]KAA9035510.1 hypothetical protein FW778_21360 [Ginsengibacter hankyongi]
MKLSEYRKKSNEYTGKASEITRQLSLAGIGIIWLFKNSKQDEPLVDHYLILPLIFLSLALFFDLIQYVLGGQIWIKFFRSEEEKVTDDSDPDIKAPKNKNIPIYIFYYAKIVLMLFSYAFIIGFLVTKL